MLAATLEGCVRFKYSCKVTQAHNETVSGKRRIVNRKGSLLGLDVLSIPVTTNST